jgi:predicted transcriptional regulator
MRGLTIHNASRTFRLPHTLDAEIVELAKAIPRHPSDLIRDAVTQYVRFYKNHLDELAQ